MVLFQQNQKGKKKITGKDVDNYNYSSGAVTVNPDDGSKPVRKKKVYMHILELKRWYSF